MKQIYVYMTKMNIYYNILSTRGEGHAGSNLNVMSEENIPLHQISYDYNNCISKRLFFVSSLWTYL